MNNGHRYYYVSQAISEKDCDYFVDQYKDVEFNQGTILKDENNKNKDDSNHRNSKVHWITEPNNLVVRALWSYILELNKHFRLIINGYEAVQLTKYEKNCFYDWHRDSTQFPDESARKLSAVLQLSKPEDYKGGKLQLYNGINPLEELPIQNQGSVIVFDSTEWHRATEVTEGVRYSLIMWASGPKLV